MMAPYEAEIAPFRLEEMRALGRITLRPRDVNWKNVADNYSDGLHIAVAHPGLTRLFGGDYGSRRASMSTGCGASWSSGRRPTCPSAPTRSCPPMRRPDLALFQAVAEHRLRPLSRPDRLHAFPAGQPDRDPDPRDQLRASRRQFRKWRREMKAARYLNWRINRRVNAEDTALIRRVQQGMDSRLYRPGRWGRARSACAASPPRSGG